MNFLKGLLVSSLFLLFIIGCDSDNEQLPQNTITSSNGLLVELEWTTGGSFTQAISEVDLDLFLTSGVDAVDFSDGFEFEQVIIENFYRDGAYLLTIEYINGRSNVDFSVFLRGTNSSDNIEVQSSFSANEEGTFIEFLEIVKSGTVYTINPL